MITWQVISYSLCCFIKNSMTARVNGTFYGLSFEFETYSGRSWVGQTLPGRVGSTSKSQSVNVRYQRNGKEQEDDTWIYWLNIVHQISCWKIIKQLIVSIVVVNPFTFPFHALTTRITITPCFHLTYTRTSTSLVSATTLLFCCSLKKFTYLGRSWWCFWWDIPIDNKQVNKSQHNHVEGERGWFNDSGREANRKKG